MFKFLRTIFGKAEMDLPTYLLATDEEYWDVVQPERFARVVESQEFITGFASDGRIVARVKKPECPGVTHDWTAGLTIDCPDHPGVFCPGGTSTFYR